MKIHKFLILICLLSLGTLKAEYIINLCLKIQGYEDITKEVSFNEENKATIETKNHEIQISLQPCFECAQVDFKIYKKKENNSELLYTPKFTVMLNKEATIRSRDMFNFYSLKIVVTNK